MRRLPVISAIAFALLASCGSDGRAQREPQAPLVQALTVEEHRFVDRIDAVGTANAREQVTLTSPITERILRLNFSDGATVRAGQRAVHGVDEGPAEQGLLYEAQLAFFGHVLPVVHQKDEGLAERGERGDRRRVV